MRGSAELSPCGRYRYRLERNFFRPGPVAAVFMVNPSTADAAADDRTIGKLLGFGARAGWSKLIVGNVFAYRSTDVKLLASCDDPVGPDNDFHLRHIVHDADVHIVAWGPLAKLPAELRDEWRILFAHALDAKANLRCRGTAKDGHPRHPLMLAYSTPLKPWRRP
jgi:hypothetical protein